MPLYGPKWPLSQGNHDTFDLYDDVKQQISYYLKSLILTSPGENISDQNYGVGLRRFMFEPNIQSIRGEIEFAISSQISSYLPYLIVQGVLVSANSENIEDNSINVRVIYEIPGDVVQEVFELNVNQETTIGFY